MLLNQYKFLGKLLFLYEKSEDYSNFYLITFFQMRAISKKHLRVKTRVIINMINILSCIKRIFHSNDKHLTIYVREINKALAWQHFFLLLPSFHSSIDWLLRKFYKFCDKLMKNFLLFVWRKPKWNFSLKYVQGSIEDLKV